MEAALPASHLQPVKDLDMGKVVTGYFWCVCGRSESQRDSFCGMVLQIEPFMEAESAEQYHVSGRDGPKSEAEVESTEEA